VSSELDQLVGWLTRLEGRVEAIDAGGTRGMGAITVQITDLARAMGELRGQDQAWQQAHERQHAADAAERARARRWLVSIGLAGVTALAGLYPLIAVVSAHH